uniref:Uncharacterized protein n=1 Tax=Nelumbo nucifera TaxID=4432 RepID=A0A822ZEW8_NELNU|nr:TPA_asm: hypothetical protein HUJ06_000521 [Nelumbo nucifera]
MRKVDKHAYKPQLISIDPFHLQRKRPQRMIGYKEQYLQSFLQRTINKEELDNPEAINAAYSSMIKKMEELEPEARRFYEILSPLNKDEFVKLMLLGGSFIIEFFIRLGQDEISIHDQDPIPRWRDYILLDLILVENQLPFSVLEMLYDEIKEPRDLTLIKSAQMALQPFLPKGIHHFGITNIKHLLDYIHKSHVSNIARKNCCNRSRSETEIPSLEFPHATKLHKAGIKLKGVDAEC